MARKDSGVIEVDTLTTLRGVPAEAWQYRLGTYSALEWVLERYKEKHPKTPPFARIQHLQVCGVQGTGDRPADAVLHGECGDDEDHPGNAGRGIRYDFRLV